MLDNTIDLQTIVFNDNYVNVFGCVVVNMIKMRLGGAKNCLKHLGLVIKNIL